jgi:hypothetical protein
LRSFSKSTAAEQFGFGERVKNQMARSIENTRQHDLAVAGYGYFQSSGIFIGDLFDCFLLFAFLKPSFGFTSLQRRQQRVEPDVAGFHSLGHSGAERAVASFP